MEAITPFLLPALLVVAFYLLIIRPARTKARATAQMQDQLAPGLEVMTTSGVFATVASVEDSAVLLEVAPGVTMRFAKAAVARIVSDPVDAGDESDASVTDAPTDDLPESDRPSR